jgi:UDP-N-acetylglucosamine:LPS N-acetylglucosamine transferase
MGGFTSLPPVYAGHKLGLKTFIHDSNARPGRANVLTSRFCTQVFLGLDAAAAFFPQRETVTTGTPVRPEIMQSAGPRTGRGTRSGSTRQKPPSSSPAAARARGA